MQAFRRQVTGVNLIGETHLSRILEAVKRCAASHPGPFSSSAAGVRLEVIEGCGAPAPGLDPAGFFVVYPEPRRQSLILEHYTNEGLLTGVFEATTPEALYNTAIQRGLVSRLDHAAYLGRELARAEAAMRGGERYVQDGFTTMSPLGFPRLRGCTCKK
ncbi:MAG: DUF4346 domain-containing protein [Thermoanaerobaculum sp.]|nr:DUF4346 domain-containing protein [Thermoanaerobaculum sp.]